MKWAIAVIFVLAAGVTTLSGKEPEKIALEITETSSHRQGRYGKGDIPLLLIRPSDSKKHQHRSNNRPTMTVAMTKSEDPAGAYSETSYILKTNDDSLTFTELLPKLGLSPNLFGLPSVNSAGSSSSSSSSGGSPQRSKPSSSSGHGSSSSLHGSSSGPVYKVALPSESPFKTMFSSSNLHGPLVGLNHVQKVSAKPQYTTTINGDDSHTIVGYTPLTSSSSSGKTSFSSSNLKPLSTISHGYKQLSSYPSSFHSGFPSSHSSSPQGVIEEIVVGKPLGNMRPSIPEGIHSQSEYNGGGYDGLTTTYEHQYPSEYESHNEASLVAPSSVSSSSGEEDSIHSLKSDHKFAHITTNYYIPHTINSEDRNEGAHSYKKPFTPSPQIDFFQPGDAAHESHNANRFRNHYQPSAEATHQQEQEEERIEYQTESTKTEDYFLPKVHSTYHQAAAPLSSSGGQHKVVYQQNPSFTSYFKFGTNVEEVNKADPRPHTFPRTESKLSYGTQFKPNPDTSFSAHPTPLEQKPAESRPSQEHKTVQYTIKQEPIDYDPYKFAPIALLKPTHAPPTNHDVTNYEQVHKDYVTKYQGGQKPNYFHREFATKFEAENYVKNAILGVSQGSAVEKRPAQSQHGLFKFEHPQPTAPSEIQPEYEYVTELNYPEGYGHPQSHGHQQQEQEPRYIFNTPPTVEHVKPVVEHPSSDPQYHLEQPFQFPSDVPSYDPSHLDLGPDGHDDGSYVEPSRATILRPSMELKETIAKKSSTAEGGDKRRRLNPRQKVISCERQCIRNSVGQEYDPVCGNDGKTYSNKGKLSCTKQCGKSELEVANIGSCALTHK